MYIAWKGAENTHVEWCSWLARSVLIIKAVRSVGVFASGTGPVINCGGVFLKQFVCVGVCSCSRTM